MFESIKYITNHQGERVGVVLDLETYNQLTNTSAVDAEILTGLSQDELTALAESMLSPKAQAQLDDLLAQNAQDRLSDDETATLDCLIAQIDQLNILKTRAKYTLEACCCKT